MINSIDFFFLLLLLVLTKLIILLLAQVSQLLQLKEIIYGGIFSQVGAH